MSKSFGFVNSRGGVLDDLSRLILRTTFFLKNIKISFLSLLGIWYTSQMSLLNFQGLLYFTTCLYCNKFTLFHFGSSQVVINISYLLPNITYQGFLSFSLSSRQQCCTISNFSLSFFLLNIVQQSFDQPLLVIIIKGLVGEIAKSMILVIVIS